MTSDRWVTSVIACVWMLNVLLGIGLYLVCSVREERASGIEVVRVWCGVVWCCAATMYALSNWSAFVWIVGSAALAIMFEIIAVLCLVYMFMIGCCVLGWSVATHIFHLSPHRTWL
jgi:hypothetical protein